MAKLSVISYNCKGINVSKVPCIKILLDRCSVLLLQETWLFSNQFTQFTKYFDKYKSINICGMDESIFCHGRPHGGCSILHSNQYDVTPIYFKEERRIVGIKISLCNSIFHIFNVYMPCDVHSTDTYDMYNHVLNTVSLYCTNNNVDTYVLGGDFNTALNRETSSRTIALNKFVSDEYLYYCCLDASSNVTYTFFGPTGSKTLIDHLIVTVNISQYVSKYYTLDLIENISDHMPLYVEIVNHTPMISSTVDTCITPRVKN